MNTDEKLPRQGAIGNVGKEEPLSVSNRAPGGNPERLPGQAAAVTPPQPAPQPKPPVREVPPETPPVPQPPAPEPPVKREKKTNKKPILIGAACVACAALAAVGLLLFRGRNEDPQLSADVPAQTDSTQPSQSFGTGTAIGTTPAATQEETLSEEELLYQGVAEYCTGLAEEGDYATLHAYLLEFTSLEYHDSRFDSLLEEYRQQFTSDRLEAAAALAADRQYRQAIQLLNQANSIWGCQEFDDTAAELRLEFGQYCISSIAAAKLNTFLLDASGKVDAYGHSMYGELAADNWSGIVAVSAGDRHVVGLRSDGTLVAAGSNDTNQMDVGSWYDIVAISAGDTHTVGLKADGTVVACGHNKYYQCDMQTLMRNAGDKRIVAIAAGYGHTLALLADGTVAVTGVNEYGECDVSGWTDIVAIVAGSEISAGLRADGTVVATGLNTEKWNIDTWTDIVALAAGDYYLVGLKADGTVVAAGTDDNNYSERGQMNVYNWSDIIMIAAGNDHTVGLKADGTILCIGSNDLDQCQCNGYVLDYKH